MKKRPGVISIFVSSFVIHFYLFYILLPHSSKVLEMIPYIQFGSFMEKNFRLALKKSQLVILTFENDQKLGKKKHDTKKSLWTLQQLLTRFINLLLTKLEAYGLFE